MECVVSLPFMSVKRMRKQKKLFSLKVLAHPFRTYDFMFGEKATYGSFVKCVEKTTIKGGIGTGFFLYSTELVCCCILLIFRLGIGSASLMIIMVCGLG